MSAFRDAKPVEVAALRDTKRDIAGHVCAAARSKTATFCDIPGRSRGENSAIFRHCRAEQSNLFEQKLGRVFSRLACTDRGACSLALRWPLGRIFARSVFTDLRAQDTRNIVGKRGKTRSCFLPMCFLKRGRLLGIR
jgi:hypothetical protein